MPVVNKIQPGDGDPRHGTPNGYVNHRCRCDLCRPAGTHKARREQQSRVERGLPADDSRHGKVGTYTNWGCRCASCTRAHSAATTEDKRNAKARAKVVIT